MPESKVDALLTDLVERLVTRIEAGSLSWSMPWRSMLAPTNATTGVAYRGMNVLQLLIHDVQEQQWATYKQWQSVGAQVRKGEKSVQLVKWSPVEDKQNPGRTRLVPYVFHVFNVAQVDGFTLPERTLLPESERLAALEEALLLIGATVERSTHAAYSPIRDVVYMPDFSDFTSAAGYYSTFAHELTHWTGHSTRCNRDLSGRFGDDAYAMEELIAELGAAFFCARFDADSGVRTDDHAAYLASWIRVLRADPRTLFTVAAAAQHAVDHLVSYLPIAADVAA
jgi:antirestriction protein ArdC